MKEKIIKKQPSTHFAILFFCSLLIIFSSCSKKSSAPSTTDKNTIKNASFVFTINVPSNLPSGFLSIIIGGGTADGNNSDLWSVNGVDQGNQTDITLVQGKDFPLGKTTTVTVTSNLPLLTAIVSPEILSNNPAVDYTYTPTINGTVVAKDAVSNYSVTTQYAPTFSYL